MKQKFLRHSFFALCLMGLQLCLLPATSARGNHVAFMPDQDEITSLATLTTTAVTAITGTTASSGGNVTADGGATVTARGVCWANSPLPTISDNMTSNGTGTGTFTSSLTGLLPNTTYYVRAYATNTSGTAYGNQLSFTTSCSGVYSNFPFIETFENAGAIPACWTQQQVSSSGINWTFQSGNNNQMNPTGAQSGQYNACLQDATTADNKTMLITPALNLSVLSSPTLTFSMVMINNGSSQDYLTIKYSTSLAGPWTTVVAYNTPTLNAWTEKTVALPGAASTYYVAFEGNARNGYGICIDNVKISGGYSDFSANATNGYANQSFTFTDASGNSPTSWAWNFGNGAVPQTANGQGPHTVYYTTPGVKTVSLTTNGNATCTKTNYLSLADDLPPRQLAGTVSVNNVNLTWYSPRLMDGAEAYPDFVYSTTNAIGNWTGFDGDGATTYGLWYNVFENQWEPSAFRVINPYKIDPPVAGEWLPHGGIRYFAFFNNQEQVQNDDWMISPKLQVSAGESFTFWAKSAMEGFYGLEQFEVRLGTSPTVGAMTTVLSGGTVDAPLTWTQFSYSLAAYANQSVYVAIHYITNDDGCLALLVDDIALSGGVSKTPGNSVADLVEPTQHIQYKRSRPGSGFVPKPTPPPVKSAESFATYGVYRNNVLLTTTAAFAYTDANVGATNGIYNYTVKANYINPAFTSQASNVVTKTFGAVNWTGATSTAWGTATNWSSGSVPGSTGVVNIPTGLTNYPVLTTTGTQCAHLNIESGTAKVTINPGANLTVTTNLSNLAGVGGLLIKSDATGTGSLMHPSPGVRGTIQRYVTGSSVTTNYVYHFVSVPLVASSNSQSSLFLGSYLFSFNEATNAWTALGQPTNNALDETRGYMIYYPAASTTYQFAGTFNNDVFNPLLTGIASAGNTRGWNLIPNPYPSYIDWDLVTTRTGVDNAIYIWPSTAGAGATQSNYYSYVGGVSTPAGAMNGEVAVGQSFFVHATSATPSITMNNASRLNGTKPFLKGTATIHNLLYLKASIAGMSDETAIRFAGEATQGFDSDWDAYKLEGGSEAPHVGTLCNDGTALSINSQPLNSADIAIPVNFDFYQDGELSMSISGIETMDALSGLSLYDRKTGISHDLTHENPVSLSYSATDAKDRFYLMVKTSNLQVNPIPSAGEVKWSDNQLIIEAPAMTGKTVSVRLSNSIGQTLMQQSVPFAGVATLDAPVHAGVYIVQVNCGEAGFSQKIVIP